MNATQAVSFKPKSIVRFQDRDWRVLKAVTPTELMLEEVQSRAKEVVDVVNLFPTEKRQGKASVSLECLHEADLAVARRRLEIIRPVLAARRGRMELVGRIAAEEGIGRSTLRRWCHAYEDRGLLSDLAPGRHGRTMPKKLDAKVEALIERVIELHFLHRQQITVRTAYGQLVEMCTPLRLAVPHEDTFRRRVADLPEKLKLRRRRGRKAAHDAYGEVRGNFPGADHPLAVVQIDHTKLDIVLVDHETRQPIGRPWLTLAIDVYSRMVVGYWLSLDPPSAFAVGMCIANAALTKDADLRRLGVDGEWPVWGLMKTLHADNGKEFRSLTIARSCEEYGISIEWRPVKTPHYGGHIERLMGTVAKEIHTLPGTTFSNTRQKGEYDSAKNAVMTYGELERWLVTWIVKVYHNRLHRSLGCSPLDQWRRGIVGDSRRKGIGLPEPVRDPQRFTRDFLPGTTRCVERNGLTWDKVVYMSDALRPWINARKGRQKVKFIVRRDPRDISRLYFLDPELQDYLVVPYRDISKPSISIWEYREGERWRKAQGLPTETEDDIFDGRRTMDGIVDGAKTETRKVRRDRERRKVRAQQGGAHLPPQPPRRGGPAQAVCVRRHRPGGRQHRRSRARLRHSRLQLRRLRGGLTMMTAQSDLFTPAAGSEDEDFVPQTETDIRILAMRKVRWIPYSFGTKALHLLGQMIDSPPSHRPPCLLIHGDTNNGKTVIARKFAKDRNEGQAENTDQLIRPVVVVNCPPYTGVGGLAARIMEQLNAPVAGNARLERRMEQMMMVMRNAGVRMVAVDEIQHILGAKFDKRIEYLNTLKDLGNMLEIPIVLIGTLEAVRAVQSDPQLGNRFEPLHVPRWQNTEDYARFLSHLCAAMRLREVSNWRSRALVTRFHAMSEGLTGESWKLMCRAAEVAVRTGREVVDEEAMDNVAWVRPSERRRVS